LPLITWLENRLAQSWRQHPSAISGVEITNIGTLFLGVAADPTATTRVPESGKPVQAI
jgi:hypothetical protein